MITEVPFFFLRHGLATGNEAEAPLTREGKTQSKMVRELVKTQRFSTVYSSPLTRAQETKEIVMKGQQFTDIKLDGLKENEEAALLLLKSENISLSGEEMKKIDAFKETVRKAIEVAMSGQIPNLVIAHGGIFLALKHIYQLDVSDIIHYMNNGIVDNCHLIRISKSNDRWKAESVNDLFSRL